jgi:sodium transport system permease protein
MSLLVVARKELRDALRDRRSFMGVLVYSLIGPAILALAFTSLARDQDADKTVRVDVHGADYAPQLVAFLESRGVELTRIEDEDPVASVRAGRRSLVLRIPADYGERYAAGETVPVYLIADFSRRQQAAERQRLSGLVQGFGEQLGHLRLIARGIAPSVARPLRVQRTDTATPGSRVALMLGGLQVFLLIATFVGSMSVAIDITAGERERRSLEPLLAQPLDHGSLFAGKWLVASGYGMVGVLLVLVASALMLAPVPLERLGVELSLDLATEIRMFVVLLPLCLLVAALQMTLSMVARSFKEAQSYLNLLMVAPMVAAFAVQFLSIEARDWMYAVPLLAQQHLLDTLMRGETIAASHLALSAATSLLLAAFLLHAGARLLGRERIVFGF